MKKQLLPGRSRNVRLIQLDNPELSRQPDMTMPEQVTPLERILKHRMQGIPVPVFNGVFSEHETPDINKMDFIELAQLREETAQGIELAKQDFHALTKQMEEALKPIPKPEEVQEKPEVSPKP